jgi:hypothetical protein
MRPTRFKQAHAVLTTLTLMAVSGAVVRPADAANPAVSECVAANEKSIKLRADHKLVAARDQAVICFSPKCPAQVRAACKKRVTDLNGSIPSIVFLAQDHAGHDLAAVRVSMDGDAIADHLDGTALSIDPGQHQFTFETDGLPTVEQSFLIVQGQKDRREVIAFAPPKPVPPPIAVVSNAPPGADSGTGKPWGTQRTLALGIGGVGVASLIVGGVTGGLAISKWNASQSECGSTAQCPDHAQSVSDHNAASTLAVVSTITFIAGGAAVAAATLLFFTAPSQSAASATQGAKQLHVSPSVGPYGGGLTLEGAF